MCGSCSSTWGACGCTGSSIFAVCPCSKWLECVVCNHYPKFNLTSEQMAEFKLADLLRPELVAKARAEYEASQKQ